MRKNMGAPASPSGSHPAHHAASGVDGPTGFDPSRWHPEQRSFAKEIADEIVRDAGAFGLGGAAIHVGAMIAAGRIWLREHPASGTSGSAQDAQRLDPKGAGPTGAAGDAQKE